MNKLNFYFRQIPGWAVILVVFGFLYLTGLHTEAIGQVQRLLLASGLRNAEMPVSAATAEASGTTTMAGKGLKLKSLSSGKIVDFKSLRGKVIFLNMWATWCPPCVAEMPNIQSLYDKVGSDKIAFVMLSMDAAEGTADRVPKFIERKGFTFPVYLPASAMPEELHTSSIPATFIISPEGKIVHYQEGMAEYDTEEVRAFLQGMVKQ
ncbi:TlpA family protein disulfide reductase [Pontibacter chitinilyticus]|uniref:TlpA family protein disulfide reductase n=1 Tax=Pontibacter chitinilyticus TaxID=2674989 RepID=UPI00321A7436